MANLYRLIAYACLGIAATVVLLLPLKAHAAFTETLEYRATQFSNGTWSASRSAACAVAFANASAANAPIGGLINYSWNEATGVCKGGYQPNTGLGSTTLSPIISRTGCSGGATYANGSCGCTAPLVVNSAGNACIEENAVLCDGLSGTETYASAPGNIAPGASSCNATGCQTNFAGTVIRVKNAEGVYVTEGAATFTGATCTYSSETGSDTDTCPGGSQGTINGIATCVPYDPSLNTIESVKDSTNSVDDGTNETVTGKTTTTVCGATGSCVTTTVTQTSVNGGAPTTTTETTEEPRNDFCKENPRDPQCANSAFAGSCAGGFTCTGDAIQCASARQIHELNCTLNKTSSQADLFNAQRSNDSSPVSVNASSKSISQADFSSSNSLGVSACIPNLSITVMGNAIDLPFSDICDELAYLRLVLLACSWFIAYRTVAGSVREG